MVLLGRKLGMTQVFGEDGKATAVTVLKAGPCVVVYKRAAEKNGGHAAVQIGFEPVKAGRVGKAQAGHCAKAGFERPFRVLRDMWVEEGKEYEVGQELTVGLFAPGQKVDVSGVSKGKGFQGVIKRHGHHGGPATHGSMFHRAPGGIGAVSYTHL
ncbi:MAG: 50S ribosomal protein L3, partial [bacterium]|nr:50S ribosomal protein L3 [bacterium]